MVCNEKEGGNSMNVKKDLSDHETPRTTLIVTVFAMIVTFVLWASLAPMAYEIGRVYRLSVTEKSILVAIPVLLGSLMRIPVGVITDLYGGRKVFTLLLLFLIIPTVGIGLAQSFTMLLFWAFLIGMAGTSFAIAITYVSKFYSQEKQGLILGIVGIGNAGTAVSNFTLPTVANHFGISITFWLMSTVTGITAILFWTNTKEMPLLQQKKFILQSFSVMKYKDTWALSNFYFVTFGSFVAFGVYLPSLLQDLFHLSTVDAGLRAAGFIILATAARPLGGYFSDRYHAGKVLHIAFLMIIFSSILLTFCTKNFILFSIGSLTIALFVGIGNGAVFKLVAQLFPNDTGAVTGIVGAVGGIGGFFPPILMGMIKEMTGNYSLGFLLLAIYTLVNVAINHRQYLMKLSNQNNILDY
ncbi:putative nitrate transporter NarT [Tepidibacillus sp. HK-1]|nr:putative nitrate transporter NarT [Tepidibacillus sp. HK-1]